MVAPRLADLLAGLSRLADLGFETGSSLRTCALAAHLARSLDLPEADVRAAFYTALMHQVGCVGHAHETALLFGDELVANMAAGRTDVSSPRDLFATFLPTLTQGRPAVERARLILTALTRAAVGETSSPPPLARSAGTRPAGCSCLRESRPAFSTSTTWGGAGTHVRA